MRCCPIYSMIASTLFEPSTLCMYLILSVLLNWRPSNTSQGYQHSGRFPRGNWSQSGAKVIMFFPLHRRWEHSKHAYVSAQPTNHGRICSRYSGSRLACLFSRWQFLWSIIPHFIARVCGSNLKNLLELIVTSVFDFHKNNLFLICWLSNITAYVAPWSGKTC